MAAEIVNPRSDSEGRTGHTEQDGGAEPLESFDPAFALHRGGKMAVQATVPLRDRDDLSLAYTPGVAKVCSAIAEQPDLVHDYTWKSSVVAVVTDGTAVLGLGDIGPRRPSGDGGQGHPLQAVRRRGRGSARPELHRRGRDHRDRGPARPVLRRREPGGHLGARCFEIEQRLQERLDIPVFHDDQHGTAIVSLAALRNAARLSGRTLGDCGP
ncbi:malic enzyme-like NAD(P)-binding protein [Streptomyces hirsutus]